MNIKTKILLILTLILLTKANKSYAQKFSKHEIKAAFVHNFIRFVAWPSEKKTLILGIVGRNEFTPILVSKLSNQKIGGITLKVIHYSNDQNYSNSDILFVANDPTIDYIKILSEIKEKPILSIGEADSFCAEGGIINFIEGNKGNYQFEINQSSAQKKEIQISSKLLKLAIQVK